MAYSDLPEVTSPLPEMTSAAASSFGITEDGVALATASPVAPCVDNLPHFTKYPLQAALIMSSGESFRLPTISTSQALGAGIAAGALALFVYARQRSAYKRIADDIPKVGDDSYEIVLYGRVTSAVHT